MAETTFSKRQLVTLAAQMTRRALAGAIGQTAFGGLRKYYETLGYPTEIAFSDFEQRYRRQDIASRIVDLPAMDTWKKPPRISEDGETQTPFVKDWEALEARLGVWGMLSRVDRLSGIGRFGVLLLGLRDGGEPAAEVAEGTLKGPQDVLYLRPFDEGQANVKTWEDESQNERYGLPLSYELNMWRDKPAEVVHWTRILHVAEGKLGSEIFGTPRLERVFNLLGDLIKFVGGSAEATWLMMRPPMLLRPQEGYDLDMTDAQLQEEFERWANDMLRILFVEGMEGEQLGTSQVVDPTGLFGVTIALMAAASGIPQRVLVGSAKGELAAAEYDAKQWAGQVAFRQKLYAEPEILRPFIDRLVWMGAVRPSVNGYHVGEKAADGEWYWPPLIEMSEAEKAEITQALSEAVKNMTHALTGQMPVTTVEAREILHLPEVPEKPDVPIATPEAMMLALRNYHRGDITADDLVGFAMAVAVEASNQDRGE